MPKNYRFCSELPSSRRQPDFADRWHSLDTSTTRAATWTGGVEIVAVVAFENRTTVTRRLQLMNNTAKNRNAVHSSKCDFKHVSSTHLSLQGTGAVHSGT